MSFKSESQRRKFHELAKQGRISMDTLDEFEDASRGKKLPEKVKPKAKPQKRKP